MCPLSPRVGALQQRASGTAICQSVDALPARPTASNRATRRPRRRWIVRPRPRTPAWWSDGDACHIATGQPSPTRSAHAACVHDADTAVRGAAGLGVGVGVVAWRRMGRSAARAIRCLGRPNRRTWLGRSVTVTHNLQPGLKMADVRVRRDWRKTPVNGIR